MKIFIPEKLNTAKDEIIKLHTNSSAEAADLSEQDLKNLIHKLVSLEPVPLKKQALILKKSEANAVARYIPSNFYSVDETNLFEVFRMRSNPITCNLLYRSWQNSYDNKKCNLFLLDALKNCSDIISFFEGKHLNEANFSKILLSKCVYEEFGTLCYNTNFPTWIPFEERLQYFGISAETVLCRNCTFYLYTFCDKEEYLLAGEEKILNIIRQYPTNKLQAFLNNFLLLFSLAELARFTAIARYLSEITGETEDHKWKTFFAGFPKTVIAKYRYWINILKINDYFGTDERSLFWKNYQFENVLKYSRSNSIIMEFEHHYVVEFLGQRSGPMYVYEKENGIFDRQIREWFLIYNNAEIRKKLWDHVNLANERMPHLPNDHSSQPGWHNKFRSYLYTHKIARRIDE